MAVNIVFVFLHSVTFIQSGAMKVVPASISDIEVDKFRNDGSLLVSWGSALINTDGLRTEIIAGAPLTPGANKDARGNMSVL